MALPVSREQLKQWCLRELGAPVIDIDVDERQLQDRLDEAVNLINENSMYGAKHLFLKYKVTATQLRCTATPTGYNAGETVTGVTSGAMAQVIDAQGAVLRVRNTIGTFRDGETINGAGASSTLISSAAVTLGDIDNKYLTIPDNVISVVRVLPANDSAQNTMFDVQYQYMLHAIPEFYTLDLTGYDLMMQHLGMIRDQLGSRQLFDFYRYENKLYIRFDWNAWTQVDRYLVIECWGMIDTDAIPKFWGDELLRKFCTALFKRQWGANLKLFNGVALLGGVTVNGKEIYDEAITELEKLQGEINTKYSEPLGIWIG